MSDCFTFRLYEPSDDKRKSVVICFASKVSLDVIAKALKQDVTDNLVPKNVYVMSLKGALITKQDCESDSFFVNEFSSYVGELDDHLRCVQTKKSGKLLYCDDEPMPEDLSKRILQCGMIALFKKHGGLITSSHGYHFSKPSGDHCDKFIRASNLLVSSNEVTLLAISLLPYMRKDLKRIYVDTSSIAYLVSVVINLFDSFDHGPPSIESFESYAVLNDPYDFVEDKSSLLLISATTSGSLSKGLLDHTSFSGDQLVTLFYSNLPNEQTGIFDVSTAIPGGIDSRKASDCKFCKRGAKLIRIAGDQFLPENPKHELQVIKKTDFSKARQSFFQQFAAKGVLGWNTAVSASEESKEHFFIAVDKALLVNDKDKDKDKDKDYVLALEKNIKRHISQDLDVVITFDDAGSKALEDKVRKHLKTGTNSIKWLKPVTLKEDEVDGVGSVMVIAGAITSGRSLLAISRKLRSIDPSATITYFIAFSKLANKESYEQLQKDLNQGGHELIVLNHCPVPRIKEYTKTAWDSEKEVLQPLTEGDPLGDPSLVLPSPLRERFEFLESQHHESQHNDANLLFLKSPNDQPLKLRRTFAFWDNLDISDERFKKITQSDVYWTIQCVLHDLRNNSENNGLATTYHTTLISPTNFDRYNDGLIQACLLRAALPVEMDYRVDAVFSRLMTDVILSVIEHWQNTQGEAALEFLMALWTKRMCVNDDHLKEIVELNAEEMPEVMKFLLTRLDNLGA